MSRRRDFGLPTETVRSLRTFFANRAEVERVWIFGSHARGDAQPRSDIDLAVDAPELDARGFVALVAAMEGLQLVRGVDVVHWQAIDDEKFRAAIDGERKLFWEPASPADERAVLGVLDLKDYQQRALTQLCDYVDVLAEKRHKADRIAATLRAADLDDKDSVPDFCKQAWDALRAAGKLPPAHCERPYVSRRDGANQPIPSICLKVPTGGGKTLLAAAAVGRVHVRYLRRHTGVVLWVVPNDAIYRQTLKALGDRDHPYRQLLNVAGGGRVKILEKSAPLTARLVASHLCVMVLMLQSAARQSKETLRFFRDRGNVHGFFPREDDIDAHWKLLGEIPNLDVYRPPGVSAEQAAAQKGSIIKDSLGNVMRRLRPMVVIDEQQRAYTENALATIDGSNPSFILELSATPRVARGSNQHGANVLVDVHGTDLEREEMIKLPINVDVRPWPDWQACLRQSLGKLDELEREARALEGETARYIRPILLVQVERTGSDQTDAGFIHANDARSHLLQLGLRETQIAIKTSQKDDLAEPENLNLLSAANPVRAIITKQALQEGWDCPFAYVLCALAAGRNPNALTQLLDRILRQPHAAKTGRSALDECYVFCHDAQTGTVVNSIKRSLEQEGMGDLHAGVRAVNDAAGTNAPRTVQRRKGFESLRVFLPRVTWCEDEARRELDYESDVLASLDWSAIDAEAIAIEWRPPQSPMAEHRLRIGLDIFEHDPEAPQAARWWLPERVDRLYVARAITDLLPNAWSAFDLIDRVVARLTRSGVPEPHVALSSDLLVQQIRSDLEAQREQLAETVFLAHLEAGRIQFRLRADRLDYEIADEIALQLAEGSRMLAHNSDGRSVERSLFDPFYEQMLDNAFEQEFACYLDSQAALRWWHRNIARAGYGLQGWRRHKVYPDFVFVKTEQDRGSTLVVMETKGAHLANEDTAYKQQLLSRLQAAFRDERMERAGELELVSDSGQRLLCGLVFDRNWRSTMNTHYFQANE